MGEGLIDPEANPVILYFLVLSYLIKSNIQPLTAAHSSSAGSARVSSSSAGSAGTISEARWARSRQARQARSQQARRARSWQARWVSSRQAMHSVGLACAPSAGSVSDVHTSKGKLPVEQVSLARRSKRLEGVHRQYVVAELFPSISDTEDDGVEFCWRDEA